MNDTATLTGTPRTITLGGERHAIAPLTIADLGKLQVWIDAQFADPFDIANAQVATGRYNAEQQRFLYRTAMELARQPRLKIGTPDADDMLRSLEGTQEIIYRQVSKAEPSFTREDAARLYDKMTFGDIARIFEVTNLDMVMSDPKAETAGETTTE